jgi:hypothetical protein
MHSGSCVQEENLTFCRESDDSALKPITFSPYRLSCNFTLRHFLLFKRKGLFAVQVLFLPQQAEEEEEDTVY